MDRWEVFRKGFAAVDQTTSNWQCYDMMKEFQVKFNQNDGELWFFDSVNTPTEKLMVAANSYPEREAVAYITGQ